MTGLGDGVTHQANVFVAAQGADGAGKGAAQAVALKGQCACQGTIAGIAQVGGFGDRS
jgi:hypothetical protein